MSKILLTTLSILISLGSVSVPVDDASACGNTSCYTTDFGDLLSNP